VSLPRTLFIGKGNGAVTWYRCALPATVLGCDWIGLKGEPEAHAITTGEVPSEFTLADAATYDVVVVQQVAGPAWLRQIREWQDAGVTVLYEVDDWLHGVRRVRHHALAEKFDRATVETYELCMRAADGIICSTDWLARRTRSLNRRTWTCRNGIDLKRYAYTAPPRDYVGIGWSGGTGHFDAVRPWALEVRSLMRENPDTRFFSIGQPFDIALAPAGKGDYFKAKSDLRWLEAAALKQPCIADPDTYPEIEHGVTGFHASTPAEAGEIMRELVADAALRERVGNAAQDYVVEHRSVQIAARSWAEVLTETAAVPAAA
jgi:hypothetical protein